MLQAMPIGRRALTRHAHTRRRAMTQIGRRRDRRGPAVRAQHIAVFVVVVL